MGYLYSSSFYLIFIAMFSGANCWASPCDIPFEKMQDKRRANAPFEMGDAYNDTTRLSEDIATAYNYRNRYLVADLNTKDENSQCKGLQEKYPYVTEANIPTDLLPELANVDTLKNFLVAQQTYYQKPADKPSIVNVGGTRYCIGQTISFCEVREGKRVEIMRLGTSSLLANSGPHRPNTYGELNKISIRGWMNNRTYTALDAARDVEMGGVDASQVTGIRFIRYVSGGGMILDNFLKWDGLPSFAVPNFYGGLHELSRGETNVNNLGAPVSHGCLRLTRYGSILARWWTPFEARFFIHYTRKGYSQIP